MFMDMESDYWNALDKSKSMRVDPNQIGISHGVGDVGEGLKANVFRGAKVVELGFMGGGKGSRSQAGKHTPESYGTREREEMRELAKINEMEVSTHASPNIGYAAGFSPQQGVFSPEMRENVLHEVERAIDFAADVGQGGPVVMHIGEFSRPMFDIERDKQGKPITPFEHFPDEYKKAPILMVDKDNGRVQALRRDMALSIPKGGWEKPELDKEGNVKFESKTIAQLEKEAYEGGKLKQGEDVGTYLYKNLIKRELEFAKGEQQRYQTQADEVRDTYEQLKRRRENLEDFKQRNPEKARYDAVVMAEQMKIAPDKDSPDYKKFIDNPFDFLKKREDRVLYEVQAFETIARSRAAEVHTQQQQVERMQPIVEYGVKKSAETIARAAMGAYEQEKAKHLEKPLWIAPENWTPEEYGAHPAEYRKIIVESRNEMANQLVRQRGMDREEANKVAQEHIKGTFDIGHANFWYKYFKGSKKEFDQWLNKEVEKLTKDGIIGHVHLSDNFGYHDEHLSPGEGNVPMEKFVEKLKESGYTGKLIAEPGGQKEGRYHQAMTEAWKLFGSPMYRIDATSQSWTDIESSYFGRAPQPPNFIVGDYAPSKDWTLWSEVPLE
jgi:sugar phosphate isomerase/epimerase